MNDVLTLSVNREAKKIVRTILETSEALGVMVTHLPNGATVIDLGQQARGSWLAGQYYVQATMGGLAEISFEPFLLDSVQPNVVRVMTGHPLEACIGSQIAGWQLEAKKEAPILAGPARALNRINPDHYLGWINYADQSEEGVISIQTSELVSVQTADLIAHACQIRPENLYILVAGNASLACAIQVPARIIEQTLHRLHEEGFDIKTVRLAQGMCVIPPLIDNDLIAMGRINDALLYGGTAVLSVENTDEAISAVIQRLVTLASPAYGRSFQEIYQEAGCDFYNIPIEFNSPAAVQINNLTTGQTFCAGEWDLGILRRSFF